MRKITKSKVKKACLKLWSLAVRERDDFTCQWCGKKNHANHAHHILSRSIINPEGFVALDNGITLCYRCHFFKKDQDPKAYLEFIEDWLLRKRDMSYEELEQKYKNKVIKWTLDDWLVALEDLRTRCI